MSAAGAIPLVNLQRQYEDLKPEIDHALQDECAKAQFILGGAVAEFEKAFAAYIGAKECISVASGTDALHLALRALGVKEGDEVVLPANSYIATALAVTYCGAKPVFADCDASTASIDLESAAKKITSKTKAIMPVHLFGQPADMDAVAALAKSRGILVVEDAAQAHGATYKGAKCGAHGAAAGFSFYPGKNLGAYGDGGAVTTNDSSLADKMRLLRNFGSPKKYVHSVIGFNLRLDTLQAAILTVKLKHLDRWNAIRNRFAVQYEKALEPLADKIEVVRQAPWPGTHARHLFVIRVKKGSRDAVLQKLQDKGVGAGIHYPIPIHLQDCYAFLGYRKGSFPVAEKMAEDMISLPLCPYIKEEEVLRVVSELKNAC